MKKIIKFSLSILLLIGFYSCTEKNNETRFIELDRFTEIQDNGKCYYSVLIDNPPENKDSLKIIMVKYFKDKQQHLDSIDTKYYIEAIWFYNKTRETSYFIDHDEDPGGFSSYILDDCHENLGTIIIYNCAEDSTKDDGMLRLYEKVKYGFISSFWQAVKAIKRMSIHIFDCNFFILNWIA